MYYEEYHDEPFYELDFNNLDNGTGGPAYVTLNPQTPYESADADSFAFAAVQAQTIVPGQTGGDNTLLDDYNTMQQIRAMEEALGVEGIDIIIDLFERMQTDPNIEPKLDEILDRPPNANGGITITLEDRADFGVGFVLSQRDGYYADIEDRVAEFEEARAVQPPIVEVLPDVPARGGGGGGGDFGSGGWGSPGHVYSAPPTSSGFWSSFYSDNSSIF